MVTVPRMQNMVQIPKEGLFRDQQVFLFVFNLLFGLSASRAPAWGPSVVLGKPKACAEGGVVLCVWAGWARRAGWLVGRVG